MSILLRKALKISYAGVQLISDSIALGSSLYFEFGSLPVAATIGCASGTISGLTTYHFQGHVIDNYFLSKECDTASASADATESVLEDLSASNTSMWFSWIYTLGRCFQKFGDNYFQVQALITWFNAIKYQQSMQLHRLPSAVFIGIMAYTILCNLPFMLSNEIHETDKKLAPKNHREQDLPSKRLLAPLTRLNSGALNRAIIWLGVMTHSVESSSSMVMMLFSPQTLQRLSFYGLYGFFFMGSALGAIAAFFFAVHLVQTLFFEGYYSLENLNQMSKTQMTSPSIRHQFEFYLLSACRKLLWTQSILHALDDAFPIVALVMSLGFAPAAYALGGIATFISFFGTQFSEVQHATAEAQATLDEYEAEYAPAI